MSQVQIASKSRGLGRSSSLIIAGSTGFDSLIWRDAYYAVHALPLQCQENKHAF
jgi:hypothetical protein